MFVDIRTNAKQVEARLKDIREKQLPFAVFNTNREVVQMAAADAAIDAAKTLDRPTKPLTDQRHNKGWIRVVWPKKQAVRRSFSSGVVDRESEAAVFIIDPLVNELHPVVYGGTQTAVPDNKKNTIVVEPTRALIKGLQGSGRLKKLNQFGNIRGFKAGIVRKLRDRPDQYLNVPVNSPDPRTRHLKPGLYFKGREIVKDTLAGKKVDTKLTRSRRRLSAAQKRRGFRVRNYLVMLLAYTRTRTIKGNKWKFDRVVVASYRRNYGFTLRRELVKAIRTSKIQRQPNAI